MLDLTRKRECHYVSETDEVRSAWCRIVHWLTAHAPASAEALSGPANDEDLARLRAALGFEVPDELEALLRINNGSTSKDTLRTLPNGRVVPDPHLDSAILPPGRVLPSSREIADQRAKWLAFGEWPGDYWRPSWIPVVIDFERAYYGYALDASGTATSRVVQFAEACPPDDQPGLLLSALLGSFAEAYERGAWEDWRVVVENGSLRWSVD